MANNSSYCAQTRVVCVSRALSTVDGQQPLDDSLLERHLATSGKTSEAVHITGIGLYGFVTRSDAFRCVLGDMLLVRLLSLSVIGSEVGVEGLVDGVAFKGLPYEPLVYKCWTSSIATSLVPLPM